MGAREGERSRGGKGSSAEEVGTRRRATYFATDCLYDFCLGIRGERSIVQLRAQDLNLRGSS